MKRAAWLGLALGALLFAGLLAYQGVGHVLHVLALAGWWLIPLTLVHLGALATGSMSVRVLLPPETRPSLLRLAWLWWVGYAVNALLPVARVGGELVRARLLAQAGVPGPIAGAAVIVGLTAGVLALIFFGASGAVVLAGVVGAQRAHSSWPIVAGLAVLGVLLMGFYAAQRAGMFLRLVRVLERWSGSPDWTSLAGSAAALDRAIVERYQNWRGFVACWLWRFAAWVVAAVEIWMAFWVIGHPISFADAFVLESLSQAVKAAGFAVPGALGVQEGGHLLVGSLLGLPGHLTIGVSLIKRARDLILGVPGLAGWQFAEAVALFKDLRERRRGRRSQG